MRGLLKKFVAEVLGFEGFEVADAHWETRDGVGFRPLGQLPYSRDARLVISVQRRWMGRCADCGRRCRNVHQHQDLRRWDDLQWAGHPVSIAYAPDRLRCRYCETQRVELLPWADPVQRETRRFQQQMALQAPSMPTLHVAAQYGVDRHKVRRAEKRALERWDATREVPALTMVGIGDKYLGRRNSLKSKFITIISNLETGEPIWFGSGRVQAAVLEWLGTLSDEQKRSITLFSMDMSQAYISAVDNHPDLNHAHIVHDPLHVIKGALEALDELRRDTFFRAGPEMRALGKGKRWLFLRAWEKERGHWWNM